MCCDQDDYVAICSRLYKSDLKCSKEVNLYSNFL